MPTASRSTNTVDLEIRIYDAINAVATDATHNAVAVDAGLFNVVIGSVTPMTLLFDNAYFLGITIIGSPELAPRTQLNSVPYSFSSRAVSGDDNVFPASGNVGVGTTSPPASLTVGAENQFQVAGTEGDVTFTDDLASITFPETSAPNAPMIQMFASGWMNANRMVIAHSPTYTDWGLQYQDDGDKFHFLRNGTPVLTVDLGAARVDVIGTTNLNGDVSVGGTLDVGSITAETIHSTSSGFTFPDGSVQTSAAMGTNPRIPMQIALLRWYENNESVSTPWPSFNVGDEPRGVAFDGANIWVTNYFDDTVTKLRASDGDLQGTFNVGMTALAAWPSTGPTSG